MPFALLRSRGVRIKTVCIRSNEVLMHVEVESMSLSFDVN